MRRRFSLALAVYAVAHLYMWWRLVWPLPSPWWQLASVLVPLFAASFPLAMTRSRHLPRDRARRSMLPGYVWFGFATYLLLGALASHVAVAFGVESRVAAEICGGIAIAVVLAGFVNVARGPVIKRVRVPLVRASTDFTIVHLTDVHVGTMIGRSFVEKIVRRVNDVQPDLVVITGDLVDGRLSELRDDIEPLRELRAKHGVYAVTGNHEYYWNVEPWLRHLRSLGVRVLRNERVRIADAIELAGTNDSSYEEDVPQAVAGRDPALPLVLLAHKPRTITRAVAAGVDLQLSGHTHGGQLLPWGWLARIWDPVVSGLARFGETWLYVSQGTGYWGPPLRVGTSCEIATLTLTASS